LAKQEKESFTHAGGKFASRSEGKVQQKLSLIKKECKSIRRKIERVRRPSTVQHVLETKEDHQEKETQNIKKAQEWRNNREQGGTGEDVSGKKFLSKPG